MIKTTLLTAGNQKLKRAKSSVTLLKEFTLLPQIFRALKFANGEARVAQQVASTQRVVDK